MKPTTIAVVSPSGTFETDILARAYAHAEARNFSIVAKTKKRTTIPSFVNGTREERLDELIKAEQINADAIWCVRGGVGAVELWYDYQKEIYESSTAPLIGYSDITLLHFMRFYRAARIGIHGPVLKDLNDEHSGFLEALQLLVHKQTEHLAYPTLKPINHFVHACLKGALLPMNLISLISLTGYVDAEFFHGKILALEDVNEPHYKIYRALHHLKNAHLLTGVRALVIGQLGPERQAIIDETIVPIANQLGIPLFDWPIFGHEKPNWPLLFGAHSQIRKVDDLHFTLTYDEHHDHTPIAHAR